MKAVFDNGGCCYLLVC